MNQDNYITLIYKKLKKEISPHEEKELSTWGKEAEENALFQQQIEDNWKVSKDILPPISIDTTKDFAGFKQRMQSQKNDTIKKEAVVKPLSSRRNFFGMAASLALTLAAALWLFMSSQEVAMTLAATTSGETKNISLADGTTITLNENSTLKYPTTFASEERTVVLDGEAYFEVESDPTRPFKVHTEKATVQVLGTKFNVRSNRTEKNIQVNVDEGKVQFSSTLIGKGVLLTKGEQGTFDLTTNQITEKNVNHKNASAWKTKNLTYKGAPLQTVIEDLERLFKVNIIVSNTSMSTCPLTARFTDATAKTVLDYVVKVYDMQLTDIDQGRFELSGGICE